MSAKVVLGIAASEFMETDYLEDAPQVHLHFLTGPEEYRDLGYGRVELCCHGCGAGLLVYYNDSADGPGHASHLKLTDEFRPQAHGLQEPRLREALPSLPLVDDPRRPAHAQPRAARGGRARRAAREASPGAALAQAGARRRLTPKSK